MCMQAESAGREKNLTMTKTKRSLSSSTAGRTNPKRSASTTRSRKKDSSRAMTKSAEVLKHDPTRGSTGRTTQKEGSVTFVSPQQDAKKSTHMGYSLEMFCSPEADRTASEQPSNDMSAPEIVEVTPEAKTTDGFLPSHPAGKRKLFPELLFEMINAESVNHPSLIRWLEDGRSFFLNTGKMDKLEEVIVPYFARKLISTVSKRMIIDDLSNMNVSPVRSVFSVSPIDGNFGSLQRQLCLYRFKNVVDPK